MEDSIDRILSDFRLFLDGLKETDNFVLQAITSPGTFLPFLQKKLERSESKEGNWARDIFMKVNF